LREATERFETGRLGEAIAILLKLGFVFTTHVRAILEQRLEEETNPEKCAKALRAIGERQTVTLMAYRDRKKRLEERFWKEVMKPCKQAVIIDREVTQLEPEVRKEKHQASLLMKAIEDGDPDWKDRLQDWRQEAKESYRILFQKVYQEWLKCRQDLLREEPCRK
jgi:hypothetical protein